MASRIERFTRCRGDVPLLARRPGDESDLDDDDLNWSKLISCKERGSNLLGLV